MLLTGVYKIVGIPPIIPLIHLVDIPPTLV